MEWGLPQINAVAKVRIMLTCTPTLAFFDPEKTTTFVADASSYGLAAVLLQQHTDGLRPVAFASRMLTRAERKYAQIKKECLAATCACKRLDRYLIEHQTFEVLTDLKSLVPLISSKDLS